MTRSTLTASDSSLPSDAVERMEMHLQAHLRGRVFRLRLTVSENGVILRGQSRTYHAKQLAQHMVVAAFRCPIAANEIVVF